MKRVFLTGASSYVGGRLEDAALGLSVASVERAFLSKVVAWKK